MKNILIKFITGLSVIISSCSSDVKKNDLEKENLKGDVVAYLNSYKNNENVIVESLTLFNEEGMIEKKYENNPTYELVIENYFYKKGLLDTRTRLKWSDGEKVNETENYIYDESGFLIKQTSDFFGELEKKTYEYKDGRLLKEYLPNGVKEYFYSTRLDSIVQKNGTYDIREYFNELGQMTKFGIWMNKGFIIRSMEYDKNGNVVLEKVDNTGDESIFKTNYTYDSRDNWIQQIHINNEGIQTKTTRKIYYKGDDLSDVEKWIESFNLSSSKSGMSNESEEPINESSSNSYSSSNNSSSSNTYSNQNQQQPEKRKCGKCNGSGKCRECSKTFSKPSYKGSGSYQWRNETRPGLVMCNDCFGRGHKQVKRDEGGWEPGEDCYIRDCDNGWVVCRTCNSYGNGRNPGQCKECDGTGYIN